MTRRDYEEMAAAVRALVDENEHSPDEANGIEIAAAALANYFSQRSSKFDIALFMRNCGF